MQFYDIILKRKAHFNYSRTFLLEEKKPQDFFLFVPKVISFDQSLTKTLIHSILNGIQYSGTPCKEVFSTASSKIYIYFVNFAILYRYWQYFPIFSCTSASFKSRTLKNALHKHIYVNKL